MSYDQWITAVNKISFYSKSPQLTELTNSYLIFSQRSKSSHDSSNLLGHVEGLKLAYTKWKNCTGYNAEIIIIGSPLEESLKVDAGINLEPNKSAYDSGITIDTDNGAVSMVAYKGLIGGHTHLAFEYLNDANIYQHVVFHLVALKSGCVEQDGCTGTEAAVLKQIPLSGGRYGFAGDVGGYTKAVAKGIDQPEENFKLLPLNNYERNLPNNDEWTHKEGHEDKTYEGQTVSIPTAVARKGRLICRKLASGLDEDVTRDIDTSGIVSDKFHRTVGLIGTNCVKFAMNVLRKIDIKPNFIMKLHALTSPPRAIKHGKLNYVARRV